jgi:7,8-dihydroneopterin aldolase/epimerase/oxygenase
MSIVHLLAEQMTVPDDVEAGRRPYRMFVRDLVLPCSIGVYPHEHLAKQRIKINVDLLVLENPGPRNDDLANVVSYDTVIAGIKALLDRGHINLVETLAEAIAELCLAEPRVIQARIGVAKLEVEPAAAGVGVEIERRRSARPVSVLPSPGGADASDGDGSANG